MQTARRSKESTSVDQRVFLSGVSWNQYEALLAMRGERARPRISYLRGIVELMSPSNEHEVDKTRLARLLEVWSEEAGIDLDGVGSWTIKKQDVERGAEPDECYIVLSRHRTPPSVPDFVIEVVRTCGGIDKLEIWRELGVREVWIWQAGELSFHLLRGARYVAASRSALLPTLAPKLLTRFMKARGTQPEIVRALRRAMRRRRA